MTYVLSLTYDRIAPRREFTNDGGFQNVSTLLHLAWSKPIWGKIRNTFFVHGSIAPAINRNYAAQFSSADLSLGSAPAISQNSYYCFSQSHITNYTLSL